MARIYRPAFSVREESNLSLIISNASCLMLWFLLVKRKIAIITSLGMRPMNSPPRDFAVEICVLVCVREERCSGELPSLHLALNTATRWADEEAAIKCGVFRSSAPRLCLQTENKSILVLLLLLFLQLADKKSVSECVSMCIREHWVSVVLESENATPVVSLCVCAHALMLSALERKCVRRIWLCVCLGYLISLKWPPSIFIKLRKSDSEGSGSETDRKTQCLALIDSGSDKRGVEMERGKRNMRWIKRRAGRPWAAEGTKAQQPCRTKVSGLHCFDMFDSALIHFTVEPFAAVHCNAFSLSFNLSLSLFSFCLSCDFLPLFIPCRL